MTTSTTTTTSTSTSPRHAYESNRARIAELWNEARPIVPGDPADQYLRQCGALPAAGPRIAWPEPLRFHPAIDYWHQPQGGTAEFVGQFPALLAALVIDAPAPGRGCPPETHAVALQRIYLGPGGTLAPVRAPIKMTGSAGPGRRAAARLAPVAGPAATLGVAVGVVNAMRLGRACRIPVWAVPNAAALAHVHWPRNVASLYVFADADTPAQQGPAAELARKAKACGLNVFSLMTCASTGRAMPRTTNA